MTGARPVNFTGTFRLAIDAKTKRINLPAKWRLASDQEIYIVPNPNGQCLSAFTSEGYQKAYTKIESAQNWNEAQKSSAKRIFGSRTAIAYCDAQGRVVLDGDQMGRVGISTKTVLVGRVENFELWAPEKWKDVEAQAEASFDDIAKLIGL